ncbi:MAG: hypothetical protein ACI93R_002865 [Flavobacteriales bacterium]|jgi:hypothetical protein
MFIHGIYMRIADKSFLTWLYHSEFKTTAMVNSMALG